MLKLVLACALALFSVAAQAQDKLPIRIGAVPATDHAPIFIGVERGIFAKHGLDAKVVMQQTGVELINGMIGGAQDVSVLGSAPVLTGAANGMPLVIIGHLHGDATRDSYSDNKSIVASAASGVGKGAIASLKGKRVGLPRGTDAETHLRGVLGQAGLALSDVTLVNLKPGDLATALRNGDVDAIDAWEPWASTAAAKVPGAVRVASGNCPSCYDPGTIVTTRPVIAAKAETLRRFMAAFAESQAWLRQNMDAAAEINMRWIPGIDLDVMKAALPFSRYDSRLSRNTIEGYNAKAIAGLVRDGKLPRTLDAATIVDPQFYAHAAAAHPAFYADLPPIPAERVLN